MNKNVEVMSKKYNGVNWAKSPAHKERRKSALLRLQEQLKAGTKNIGLIETVPLSDKDIKRINKEIAILESKLS